jgi:hypothetical protein
VFERVCQTDLMDNYGEDKEIYITTDDNYTHAVILNTGMPNLSIPKQNVVGLAFEPPLFLINSNFHHFIEYAKQNIGKYCIGSTNLSTSLPEPFIEKYSYMWHITPPRTIPIKTKTMSIMVSQKNMAPGHKYRHALVQAILNTNLDIDIYGRGCQYYNRLLDKRIKGEFTDDNLYKMFESYQFHICIENFQTASYTSEKYISPVLWGATPIYWGATQIEETFPGITIPLSGNIQTDMNLLKSIMENPSKYKKEIDQSAIRPKMNLLKNLDDLFSM